MAGDPHALRRKLVSRFHRDVLEPNGFEKLGRRVFERRSSEELVQGIEFQPHRTRFTVNVYWKYVAFPGRLDSALDYYQRIRDFLDEGNGWFEPSSEAELESAYTVIAGCFERRIWPFLEAHRDLEAVVAAHEAGELSDVVAFGTDPGWRSFNLGFAYLHAGQPERARAYFKEFQAFDAEHGGTADYEVDRRQGVEDALRALGT